MAETLSLSMFANYGVFIFSSTEKGIQNVNSQLILGKEEKVQMLSNQAFTMNMRSNTFKVSNILIGAQNYANY